MSTTPWPYSSRIRARRQRRNSYPPPALAGRAAAKWLTYRIGLLMPRLRHWLPLALAVGLLAFVPMTPSADAQEHQPARIEALPTWHDGSPFTFELHFQSSPNLSYTVVRDDLFEVDGGDIRRARRITQGSSLSWEVHVAPDGFGDVGITGLGMSAVVPGPGERLVARISELPSSHNGEAFEVRLEFNQSPRLSFRTLRDVIVEAEGGTVQRARRVTQGDNSAWTLTIRPDGDGAVGISVPVTQSCDDDRAVCTRDGEMLANGVWRTVRGPARDTLERPEDVGGPEGDTLERPQDTVRVIETQPVIRNIQPAQSAPPDAGPTGQTGPGGQSGPTGQSSHTVRHFLDWDFYPHWPPPVGTSLVGRQTYDVGASTVQVRIADPAGRLPRSGPDTSPVTSSRLDGSTGVANRLLFVPTFEQTGSLDSAESVTVTFAFDHPGGVSDISFTLYDVDNSTTASADWIATTATLANGDVVNPSTITTGTANTRPVNTDNQVIAIGAAAADSADGNAAFVYNQTGITELRIRIRNANGAANLGYTDVAIGDIGFTAVNPNDLVLDWDVQTWSPQGSQSRTYRIGGHDVSLTASGDTGRLFNNSPRLSAAWTGGVTGNALVNFINFQSDGEELTWTLDFDHPGGVTDVGFTIVNVDGDPTQNRADEVTASVRGTDSTGARFGGKPSTITHGTANSDSNQDTVTGDSVVMSTLSANGNATFTFDHEGITEVEIDIRQAGTDKSNQVNLAIHDISFTWEPPALAMTAPPNQAFTVGTPVSVELPEATGGCCTRYYSISNNLPAGLDYDPDTRTISGTPTAVTSGSVEVRHWVTNGIYSASAAVSITVNAAPTLSADDQTYGTSAAIPDLTLPPATGGSGTITYEVEDLPPGLSFDPATRVVSGTPTTPGTYTVTYKATDANGAEASTTFDIVIERSWLLDWNDVSWPRTQGGSLNLTETYSVGGADVTFTISGDTNMFHNSSPGLSNFLRGGMPASERSLFIYKQLRAVGARPTTTLTIDFAHEGGVSNVRLPLFDVDGTAAGARVRVVATATAGGSTVNPTGIETSASNEQHGDNAVQGTARAGSSSADANATFTFSQSEITQIALVLSNQGANDINTDGYSLHDVSFSAAIQPLSVDAPDDLELTVGRPVGPVSGTAVGGDESFTYSITPALPTGLSLDTMTGEISGTPTGTSGLTTYTYTATDGASSSDSDTFTIKVNRAPTLSSPDTLYFATGKAIPPFMLDEVVGGTGSPRYEVTGLPTGLSFDQASQTLSGTPTTAGTTTATYTVTDQNDAEASVMFDIVVVDDLAYATLDWDIESWPEPVANVPTLTQTFDVGGGQVTVTFDIPADVTLDTFTTGQASPATSKTITGGMDENSVRLFASFDPGGADTITATIGFGHTGGVNNVRFKVLDIDQLDSEFTDDTTDQVTVTATKAGATINPTSVVTSLRNEFDGTNTVTGTGEAGNSQGGLPDIFGNGTAAFRFATEDITEVEIVLDEVAVGSTAAGTVEIALADISFSYFPDELTITAPSDRTYTQSTAIPDLVFDPAAGGVGGYTYEIVEALPTGLDFDGDTRTLSGTPSATQAAATYTYRVTDADDTMAEDTFQIIVRGADAVAVSAPSDQVFTEGQAITAVIFDEATGGDGSFTYALAPAPPTGLTFTPATRTLSGTPSASSPQTTYTYTATDGTGASDSATLDITVNVAPSVSAPSNQNYMVNQAITALTLEPATGGTPPFTYALSANLPAGLSFDPATRVLSGTPTTDTVGAVTVTYTATDANEAPATDTFDITVSTGNRAPVFDPDTASRSIAENSAGGTNVGAALPEADDADGDTLTYSLGGTDAASFDFNATSRQLTVAAGATLNHESDPTLTVTVTATDGSGATDELTVTITVTDVAEPPSAPAAPTVNAVAGSTTSLRVTWTAPDNAGKPAITTYDLQRRIVGGQWFDGRQNVSGTTATIGSLVADTVYRVRVRATNAEGDGAWSGEGSGRTNAANTAPTVANAIPDQTATAGSLFTYTFPANTFSDPDGDALTYAADRPDNTNLPAWITFTAATRTFTGTPLARHVGLITARVTASDGTLSVADTFDIVISAAAANNPPVFTPDTAARSIAENSAAGTNVGLPLHAAIDPDTGDTVTHSLGGDDADSFAFNATSRQLTVAAGATLNHESDPTLTVTITATDGSGATDELTVTITVTDEEEPPGAPNAPTVNAVAGSTTSLGVTWTAPDNAGKPAITNYDLQYRTATPGATYADGPQDVSGTTATIGSLTAGTTYQVRVRATNAEGDGDWSNPTSGTTNTAANNAPTVANPIPDVQATAGVPLSYTFGANTFNDADTGDTLTYAADLSSGANLPTWLTFTATTREFSATATGLVVGTYSVRVTASDGNGGSVSDTFQLTVNRAPTVSAPADQTYTVGTQIAALTLDAATGGTPPFTYALSNVPNGLSFNATSRVLSGTPTTATTGAVTLTYTATDDNLAIARDTFMITVNMPANRAPAFPSPATTRSIAENSSAGANVGVALPAATDPDGDTVTYTFGGTHASSFVFNATTRHLTVGTGTNLNHESQSTYTVTLTATDGSASAVLTVTIRVTDEDEPPSTPAAPTVNTVSGSGSVLRVTWTAPSNTGKPRITSYDLQYKRTVTSSWSNGPQNVTGTSRTITGLNPTTSYDVRVRATNHEGDSPWSSPGSGMTDMEPLRLTSPGNLSFVVDRAISPPVTLPEATGGQGTRTYQITPTLPLGMRFNNSTRELDGTPTVLQGFQTYNYQVTDSSGSDTETFRIAITVPMLTAPTVGHVYATVGVPISPRTLPTFSGAQGDVTYQLTGKPCSVAVCGSLGQYLHGLPHGFSFNPSSRVLSGTGDVTLTRELAYTATDSAGSTGTALFQLHVRPPLGLPEIDDVTVADDAELVRIKLPEATDGHKPYSYSVSGLPFGVWYDQHRHEIYDTPMFSRPPRDFEIRVTARDESGASVARTFTLRVLNCAAALDPVADMTLRAGTPMTPVALHAARAGCGDVAYELEGLPGGLSFNPATRTLSGIPTADAVGPSYVTYRATDSVHAVTQDFLILVRSETAVCGSHKDAHRDKDDGPIDLDSDLYLPDPDELWLRVGEHFSVILPEATGGDEPLTYSVRGLPEGMCFDPVTRGLSGMPPETGFFTPDYIVQGPNRTGWKTFIPIHVKE